jgi:pyruvate formate lyase activating enzyme
MIFDIQEYSIQDGRGIRTTVFLKGCPLRCRWCDNPEGQRPYPELMHARVLCKKHHKCFSGCRNSAIGFDPDGYPVFTRASCQVCTERVCEERCPERAIKIVGRGWTAEALYNRVRAHALFYRNSGGGVTLSGGEPLAQPEFVGEFLNLCEKTELSVGMETCGLFDWDQVKIFIGKFDFIYFDIKCLDTKLHQDVTGCGNEEILHNLTRLAGMNPSKITVTIPVIPGVNTSMEMMGEVAALCHGMSIGKVRLLPYHSFGAFKYEALGREYLMERNLSVDRSLLENYRAVIREKGIDCWIE